MRRITRSKFSKVTMCLGVWTGVHVLRLSILTVAILEAHDQS